MPLKKPQDFTANGLRHYWATVSQTNSEMKKHMPKFLGHTTLTHQKFYEMPLADIHLNVVGPLIRQLCLPTSHATSESDRYISSTITSSSEQSANISSNTNIGGREVQSLTRKRSSQQSKNDGVDSDYKPEDDDDDDLDDDDDDDDEIGAASLLPKRNRWNTPEKNELFDLLPETVLGMKTAGRGEIRKAWVNSKVVKKRHSLQMTRIEVSKYRTKKKKIPTPIKTNLMKRISE